MHNDALPDDYKKLMTDYNILNMPMGLKKDVIESLFTLAIKRCVYEKTVTNVLQPFVNGSN